MKSGQLRERIEIQRRYTSTGVDTAGNPILEIDSSGQPIDDWTEYIKVRAKVTTVSGRELLTAGATVAPFDARFLIRWTPLAAVVDTTYRIVMRSVVYNIVSAPNVNMRNREIEIMGRSGVNLG